MTAPPAALSSQEVPRAGTATASVTACAFCRRRLGGEYFFSCRRCDATYCYIHMSRHRPSACAREEGRRARAPRQGAGQLLLAAVGVADSSANV